MSLTVSVYYKDEIGRMAEPLKPRPWETKRPQDDPEWTELPTGGEVWRTEVYAPDVVRSLGFTLLPTLAQRDIWAIDSDFDRLEQEAEAILVQAEQVARQTGYGVESITSCLTNIKSAAINANEINGGVVI